MISETNELVPSVVSMDDPLMVLFLIFMGLAFIFGLGIGFTLPYVVRGLRDTFHHWVKHNKKDKKRKR